MQTRGTCKFFPIPNTAQRSLRCMSRSGNYITCLIWLPYGDKFLARNWKMLSQNFTSTIYLDKISVLIGNPRNEHIVNALMIITKHEIFNVSVKALLSILDIWSQYLKSTYKLRFIWVQSRTSWPKCLEKGLPFTMFDTSVKIKFTFYVCFS